ncbi:MAG: response regulator [Spirochaetales bacterium]|jgi:two-component system, response regulator YesN|nr:response regulator [Spirochaetales bacterium]
MNSDQTIRICVAEDEPKILTNIVKKIQMAGPEFTIAGTAGSGIEALKVLETQNVDVLVTDVVMPMMDGLELVKAAKARLAGLHCIIVSGHDDFAFAKRALQFGVEDYLLKPLKLAPLKEILGTIKERIRKEQASIEKRFLFSVVHGDQQLAEAVPAIRTEEVFIALICIGNAVRQADSALDPEISESLRKGWHLASADTPHIEGIDKWWLIDDDAPNQKFLVAANTNEPELVFLESIKQWKMVFTKSFAGSPVKIFYSTQPVSVPKIPAIAAKCRKTLFEYAQIGKEQIIDINVQGPKPDYHAGSEPDKGIEIAIYLKSGEKTVLVDKVHQVLEESLKSRPEQAAFEATVLRIVSLLYTGAGELRDAVLNHVQSITVGALARNIANAEIARELAEAVCLYDPAGFGELTPERIAAITEQFIRDNYRGQILLSDVSDRMGFSSAYLSRIFKACYGTPPIQYLNSWRIKKSIELMKLNPDLDIKNIGELCGFPDQHYFSRVFRKTTGMPPTKYKELNE